MFMSTTNMCHIHISTVSTHVATRDNNKILRTHPPYIFSSEYRLPRLSHRTLALLRTNKSPFLKSYLHKVDAKSHSSPLCPLCKIHRHNTHLFNCTHIRTTLSSLDGVRHGWPEKKLTGGPHVERWDSPPPPLSRVKGVGR